MDNKTEILEKLKEMHPTAGCELVYSTPFELLVAVILSAQCTDKRVNMATEKLFKVYNTPEAFASLSMDELKKYIFSCGFYNNKGKNIIEMSRSLLEKFGGEVPRDMESLTSLAGVGRKTASVVLSVAFEIPAMPVDTHVFRVSRRIGFAKSSNVEGVEKELKQSFEDGEWNILHHTLIFHGRYICHSQRPNCSECKITNFCKHFQENGDTIKKKK